MGTFSKVLGIIPARGGSKGVKRKNIKLLGGKPLVAYTILAAQGSKNLTKVVLSTEDDEISNISLDFECEVIKRPARLAADDSTMISVVLHVLEILESKGENYDYVFILQPTTPFRHSEDIDETVRLIIKTGADSVIGVVRMYDHHPIRVKKIENNRLVPYCVEEDEEARRQDLPPAYLRNGAVYVVKREIIETGSLRGAFQYPYIMPPERSVNIDDELDFLLAEAVLKNF